jgi:putative peptide zinc metalloprotease protein
VRPQADGVVQTVHAKDGDMVQAGALLVTLHNPKLYAQRERITSQLAQAEQGAFTFMGSDLSKAGQAGDQMQRWQAELHHVDEQIEALQVRAHRAGRLVLTRTEDLPGRYLHRGELLGHVLSDAPATVRMAVQDQDITTLRANARSVSIAGHMLDASSLQATLLRDSVAATHLLPNAALSTDMGGQIQTDPQDEHHTRTVHPVVLMDVQVATQPRAPSAATSMNNGLSNGRLGERVWVRFDQGWSPLPSQAWRWVQRRALVDFNPQH